jgi:4-alpha-glucanotransferase
MSTAGNAAKLYIDLPLGVDNNGYDIWRERALFAEGMAAGAPPDALFRGGQNWGFRPLIPGALRNSRYAYLIEVLQHHMRHAGALRIDHVMSLVRLYWVPSGYPATEGVYVRYPRDELLALLTLLSDRHGTVLIGEDLGTVPGEVRASMDRHGLLRMQVLQFELGGAALPRSPRAVAASFGTHDTPTLAGFWRALDIDDQQQLGLLGESGAAAARAARARLRRRVCRALGLDAHAAEEVAVLRGLMHHLASGRARLVLLALEDLWLEPLQQNVPGTCDERPNWRRRARFGFDAALERPEVIALLREVDRLRNKETSNAQ